MRIKQKELIGKTPRITYTKTLSNQSVVIVQVFDSPKCVNMIKRVEGKVVERQCYPLTDELYNKYIDDYFKYYAHSHVDRLVATYTHNTGNTGNKETLLTKLRRLIWS